MKPRMFTAFVVVVSLALMLTVSTAAQRPGPSTQRPITTDGDVFLSRVSSSNDLEPQTANAPAVAVGQPGLSLRYAQTFGTTEVAYFDDNTHVNGANGG